MKRTGGPDGANDAARPRQLRLDDATLARHRRGSVLALDGGAFGCVFSLRSERSTGFARMRAAVAAVTGAPVAVVLGAPTPPAPVVAVVDVFGPLEQRAYDHWCGWAEGYDTLTERCLEALADPEVVALVLRVDSPGGDVAGLEEALRRIGAARDASGKPVLAYIDERALSAACWIVAALATYGVFLPAAGGLGSIGAIGCYVDESAANEADGIHVELVRDPPGKAESNPEAPIRDLALARIGQRVAEASARFAAAMQAVRGIPLAAIRALNGAVLYGQVAVDAGLADGIASLEDVVVRAADLGVKAAAERTAQTQTQTQTQTVTARVARRERLAARVTGRLTATTAAAAHAGVSMPKAKVRRVGAQVITDATQAALAAADPPQDPPEAKPEEETAAEAPSPYAALVDAATECSSACSACKDQCDELVDVAGEGDSSAIAKACEATIEACQATDEAVDALIIEAAKALGSLGSTDAEKASARASIANFGRAVYALTGASSALAAEGTVRAWQTAHGRMAEMVAAEEKRVADEKVADEKRQAKAREDAAKAEAAERIELVRGAVLAGKLFPGQAWAVAGKPERGVAPAFAEMRIETLRAFVAEAPRMPGLVAQVAPAEPVVAETSAAQGAAAKYGVTAQAWAEAQARVAMTFPVADGDNGGLPAEER